MGLRANSFSAESSIPTEPTPKDCHLWGPSLLLSPSLLLTSFPQWHQNFPKHLHGPSPRSFPGDRWRHTRHMGRTVTRRAHVRAARCWGWRQERLWVPEAVTVPECWGFLPFRRLQKDLDVSTTHLLQPNAGGFLCRQVGCGTTFLL